MGTQARPIFDQAVSTPPPSPIFPTNSTQATGMANIPGPLSGAIDAAGSVANGMQLYRDAAVGKLARIHAMIDAGQLPQTALADPSLQPLFHQAGLDQEGHLALLPKNSDTITNMTAAQLGQPDLASGTPGGRAITGLPQKSAGNIQDSLDTATMDPAVAADLSKAPSSIEAQNMRIAKDTTSRAEVTKAGTSLKDANLQYQVAIDDAERYKGTHGEDRVYRNAIQAAHENITAYYVETMKQAIAASQLSAAAKQAASDSMIKDFENRAQTATTARHEVWQKAQQAESERISLQQMNEDSEPDVKANELKAGMAEWNSTHKEPTLPDIMQEQIDAQSDFYGITKNAQTAARANEAGFNKNAGTALHGEVGLLDNIEKQLLYANSFTINAPEGTMIPDGKGGYMVAPKDTRLTLTAEQLLRSNQPWATPSLKAHVKRFLAKGNPTLVNDPTQPGAGGHGSTPLSPGGVGMGSKSGTRAKGTPPQSH